MLPFAADDIPDTDEDDIDPFEELEIGISNVANVEYPDALSELEEDDDPLSAFEDDGYAEPQATLTFTEDPTEEDVVSFDDKEAPAPSEPSSSIPNKAEATYRLLLETVWIDDILDPSEVELLARKRGELGISFERHLQLVRSIIGE
ncbi:MAG: hypothetical protein QGI21_07295 [Candidatus Poseidoniaceae archaeon]|nr:hypothetical protein [Candidatus Poseidoniaceae archaeon]